MVEGVGSNDGGDLQRLAEPVSEPRRGQAPQEGVGLCLSGGGYRAMLFHLGTLWRLQETALLGRMDRISSVSGGSITAGALAIAWPALQPGPAGMPAFKDRVVAPIRRLARQTTDVPSVWRGLLLPGTVSDRIARAYDRTLFRGATLQSLPDEPRFVLNATNVQTGALWRFSKPFMGDYRTGRTRSPDLPLARAVAASSAFPPVLSPTILSADPARFPPERGADLQRPPFTSRVVLTDGGVYDNLGLETVWKRYSTVLVSDAGGKTAPEEKPHADWGRHAYRVLDLVDNQVRSLRKRQLIGSYLAPPGAANHRGGAYWGIRSDIAKFPASGTLPCPHARTIELARIPTRLAKLDDALQERLINWGYAVCDAALRAHVDPRLAPPPSFPYPRSGV